MDRFKYRYWQHKDWKDNTSPLEAVYCNIVDGCDPTVAVSDFEMSTGLKDKNSKLIYEGDIVKDINGHYGYIKWDNEELKYFVCKRLGVVPYLTPCSMVHSYEYEIVGNIHENKDLLEDK